MVVPGQPQVGGWLPEEPTTGLEVELSGPLPDLWGEGRGLRLSLVTIGQ